MKSSSHSQNARYDDRESPSLPILESLLTNEQFYKGPKLETLPLLVRQRLELLFRHTVETPHPPSPEWCIHCSAIARETSWDGTTMCKETIEHLHDFDLGIKQKNIPSNYTYNDKDWHVRITMHSPAGKLLESESRAWPDDFCELFCAATPEDRGTYHTYQIIELTITHPAARKLP